MKKRWMIVLTATMFNLLFEYSLRGFKDLLTRPLLPLFIFPIYFTWFIALEDLIGRFKLKDYQVVLLAFIFGSINSILFMPGKYLYAEPLILGFNWFNFIWIFAVWWISLQAILALYIGNRIFPRKEWKPLLSWKGWIITVLTYFFFGTLFRIQITAAFPTLLGYLMSGIFLILAVVIFIATIKRKGLYQMQTNTSIVMDILSLITIILFTALAILSPGEVDMYDYHPISRFSLIIVVFWNTISAVIFYLYRIFSRKQVRV